MKLSAMQMIEYKKLKEVVDLYEVADALSTKIYMKKMSTRTDSLPNSSLHPNTLLCLSNMASNLARTINDIMYEGMDLEMSQAKEKIAEFESFMDEDDKEIYLRSVEGI